MTGQKCSSETFRIDKQAQDRLALGLKEAQDSGAEVEVVDSSKNYGIIIE